MDRDLGDHGRLLDLGKNIQGYVEPTAFQFTCGMHRALHYVGAGFATSKMCFLLLQCLAIDQSAPLMPLFMPYRDSLFKKKSSTY